MFSMKFFIHTILLVCLIAPNVNGGPVAFSTCMGTCMGFAWMFSIPVVAASGGTALPILAAAYAGAGAGLTGQCAATCTPLLLAPTP